MSARRTKKNKIDEDRAAALLGLDAADLRRLSRETGLGQSTSDNGGTYLVFTYAELYRLCRMAAQLTTQ